MFNYTERVIIDGERVEKKYVKKAFTSVSMRNNTQDTALTQDIWARMKTNAAYTVCAVDSGNCQIIDNGDQTYNCRYIDTENLHRNFLMLVSMQIDFSLALLSKTIEFRMVIKRGGVDNPLDVFASITSSLASEALASSAVLQLQPNDEVYFELRNVLNSGDICVKFASFTVVEI
jgi:hypothetical protein